MALNRLLSFCTEYIKDNFLLLSLLAVTIFFRAYNITTRYSWGYESIRDANVAVIGARTLELPLTGPFSSLGPFTFGPWYWYQLILFQILLPFKYSPWILLSITSILFIFLLYKIGEILGGQKLGFTIAILAAVSRYLISWSTLLTNPGFIFVYAALSLYLFLRIIKQETSLWVSLLFGISIGIGINIHYQMLPYLFLILLLSICKFRRPFSYILASIGVGITFIPFVIFDIINKGYMIKTIISSYLTINERIYVPNSWKLYLFDFWPNAISSTLGIPHFLVYILIFLTVIVFVDLILRRKVSRELFLLILIFFVFILQLRYYGGERFMGYIHYLVPLIFIFIGYTLWYISLLRFGRQIYTFIFLVLLLLILPKSITEIKDTPQQHYVPQFYEVLSLEYPHDNLQFYHCTTEDPGTLMSLMYIDFFNKSKADKEVVKIGLNSKCMNNLDKKSKINYSKTILQNKEVITNFRQTSDTELMKYKWEHYTMRSLYQNSVFWWKQQKIE